MTGRGRASARDHGLQVLATTARRRRPASRAPAWPGRHASSAGLALHDGLGPAGAAQEPSRHPPHPGGGRARPAPAAEDAHRRPAGRRARRTRGAGHPTVASTPPSSTWSGSSRRSRRSLLVVTERGRRRRTVGVRQRRALFGALDDVDVDVVRSVEDAYGRPGRPRRTTASWSTSALSRRRRLRRAPADPVAQGVARHSGRASAGGGADHARRVAAAQPYADVADAGPPATLDAAARRSVGLFLHRADVAARRVDGARRRSVRDGEQLFAGRRILIVDDDVRNVFALTSALEQHGIDVLYADSGEAGIETLQRGARRSTWC